MGWCLGKPAFLSVLLAMLLAGSIRDHMPPTVRKQVTWGVIQGSDLPFGWAGREGKGLTVGGGYGQDVSYRGADRSRYSFVYVSQTLEIYPDEATSRGVYQQRVTEAIPPA